MRTTKHYIVLLSLFTCSLLHGTPDSLQHLLPKTDSIRHTEQWLKECLQLSEERMDEYDHDTAGYLYMSASRIAEREGFTEEYLNAEIGRSKVIYRGGDHKESLRILDNVIAKSKEDYTKIYGKALRYAGMNHIFMGNFTRAYELQKEALQIFEGIGDSLQISSTYYGLGNNFFYQEQYELSAENFLQSLKICESVGDEECIYRSINAISSAYEYLGDFETALKYGEQALDLAHKLEDKGGEAWTLLNMGSISNGVGDNETALSYLFKAEELAKELNDLPLQGYVAENLSLVYKDLNQIDLALKNLDRSKRISIENDDRSNLVSVYKTYMSVYQAKGDFENYQKSVDLYVNLKDSLLNEQMVGELSAARKSFEMERLEKEQEIALLKKDSELAQVRNKATFFTVSIVIISALLFLFIMLRKQRFEKEKNAQLEQKNEEILRQNRDLAASNRDLEQYAYIISHDLKEPLRNISGFTRLLERSLDDSLSARSKEYINFIKGGAQQMHHLLEGILEYSQIKSEARRKEKVNTNEIVRKVLDAVKLQTSDVRFEVGDLPVLQYNKAQLYQVFQNLITNAVKFRQPDQKSLVKIECKETEEDYVFSVTDNGIGIEKKYLKDIFIVFRRLHDRGRYKGTGIGLATCKKIVEEYGGQISVESLEGLGSKFSFSVPITEKDYSEVSTEEQSQVPAAAPNREVAI